MCNFSDWIVSNSPCDVIHERVDFHLTRAVFLRALTLWPRAAADRSANSWSVDDPGRNERDRQIIENNQSTGTTGLNIMKNRKKTATSRLGQCRRILSQRFRPPVFLLAIVLLLTSAALAQLTTADILGTVTDQTGASVPNATVTLTNLGTNDQRTVQSNGSGDYTFTLLPVGHYSISVKAGGFQESITKDFGVEAGDRARADIHLQVGSQTAVVEVTATTPLLQKGHNQR